MDILIKRVNGNNLDEIEIIEKDLEHRILSSTILNATLNKENYYFLLATLNNIPVGYIAAEHLVDHIDILSIAVIKDYRKKHIATLLLNELLKLVSSLDIQSIFLEVRCNNISAIKFYEKNEFKKIDCRKNYYTDTNEDAYIYIKTIN